MKKLRLYHFLNRQFALEDIEKQRIKISRLNDLNDPFELLGPNLRDEVLRRAFLRMKDLISERSGIICMSRRWRNPLLWSHYADRHRGVCLGFDVPESFFQPVIYSTKRLDASAANFLSPTVDEVELMLKIARFKFEHWSYEEEYRAFVDLNDPDPATGYYFYQFGDQLALKEIILGSNCDAPKPEIQKLLHAFPQEITIRKARPAFKSFDVVERKNW